MVDTSQSFKIVSPDSEGNLVLFSKDLQGIRENGLATDALIRKDVECEFHIQFGLHEDFFLFGGHTSRGIRSSYIPCPCGRG